MDGKRVGETHATHFASESFSRRDCLIGGKAADDRVRNLRFFKAFFTAAALD